MRPLTPFAERYGQWSNPFVLLTAVRGHDAMQMFEPQYVWGVFSSWLHSLLAGSWSTKMRKR
jgi:hypothetical protein